MTLAISHRPRPYTRTTRKQQWVDERWHKYLASRDLTRLDVRQQMADNGWEMYPARQHLSISIHLYTGATNYNNIDADNELKGILDALQGVVFKNDAWVDELYMIRCQSPKNTGMAIVRVKAVTKKWLVRKALGLARVMVREHGVIGAVLVAIGERIKNGQES
jgi:Holliday junction resolvase RusA-like endonuclease